MRPSADRVEPVAGLRLAAVVVAVLAAIGLLALASRGLPGSAHGKARPVSAGHAFDYLLALGITAWAVGIVYGVIQLILSRRLRRRRRPRPAEELELWTPDFSRVAHYVLVVLVIALLSAPLVVAYFLRPKSSSFKNLPSPLASMLHGVGTRPFDSVTSTVRWSVPLAVGLLAVALITAARNDRLYRRRHPLRRSRALAQDLVGALDESLDDIEAEADPRSAVIRSYARMERVLDGHGLPRRSHETPFEFLARVLQELRTGGPGTRRLTELYERARFSTHVIDAEMKTQALDAVRTLRAELETGG